MSTSNFTENIWEIVDVSSSEVSTVYFHFVVSFSLY